MYTYIGALWAEQNIAVKDDDATGQVVISLEDELVD